MRDTGELKRAIGIGIIARSSLIGITCGLAYELAGFLLQFAWAGIGIHGGPVSQIRFLQAFTLGLLVVALAGFLPAAVFRMTGRELTIATLTGGISGMSTGITMAFFDYLQHFEYFADRAFSFSTAGSMLNVIAVSPQLVLLITAACAIIGTVSALLYVTLDLYIG